MTRQRRAGIQRANALHVACACVCVCVCAQVAESRREASLASYVQDQLEYSKLWRLLEFGDKLDNLLQVCMTASLVGNSSFELLGWLVWRLLVAKWSQATLATRNTIDVSYTNTSTSLNITQHQHILHPTAMNVWLKDVRCAAWVVVASWAGLGDDWRRWVPGGSPHILMCVHTPLPCLAPLPQTHVHTWAPPVPASLPAGRPSCAFLRSAMCTHVSQPRALGSLLVPALKVVPAAAGCCCVVSGCQPTRGVLPEGLLSC